MWEIIGVVAGIIAVVVAIFTLIFVIFSSLRSKQVYRSVLTFNNGLLYANEDIEKAMKKDIISTLIYGASIPENSDVTFACLHLLINNSKLPIHNITLQLEYALKHAIDNNEIIGEEYVIKEEEKIIDVFELVGHPTELNKNREVQVLNSKAQVRYSIESLRPGERIVVADHMKFTHLSHHEAFENGNYALSNGLLNRLKEIKKLCDFCVVDIFIYSESCPPLSKRTKLLWFDTNSIEELIALANDAVVAFWGRKWLKPGIYFHGKWKRSIIIKEYSELIVPKLKMVKLLKNKSFFLENPLNSEREMVVLQMPPWNYYQLGDNMDTDYLLKKSGFIGPILPPIDIDAYKKFLKKIHLWNILKGKIR